jgi:hypothetical protein
MQFRGEDENDDSQVREVIEGKKTATVCKADEYYLSDGDYDDGDGKPEIWWTFMTIVNSSGA